MRLPKLSQGVFAQLRPLQKILFTWKTMKCCLLASCRMMALTLTPSCSNHSGLLTFSATTFLPLYLCLQGSLRLKYLHCCITIIALVYFLKHNEILTDRNSAPCLTAQINKNLWKAYAILLCFAQFTLSRNTTHEERERLKIKCLVTYN